MASSHDGSQDPARCLLLPGHVADRQPSSTGISRLANLPSDLPTGRRFCRAGDRLQAPDRDPVIEALADELEQRA